MNLTKEKLVSLWRMRKSIFENPDNRAISERFDFIKETFNIILSHEIVYKGDAVYMDGKQIVKEDGSSPSLHYFGCKKDKMTASGAYNGVRIMAESFPEYKEIITRIANMLGGFDENEIMQEKYRIISNIITDSNDNGSLISVGQVRHPSSHFADNNYFFNVIDTIKRIAENTFDTRESRLVLRWPGTNYYGFAPEELDERAIPLQRAALIGRFPYKFFYMWVNAKDVIHPVSLMAYRNLVQQKDSFMKYDQDYNMDQSFADFIGEKGWGVYSRTIASFIPEEERGENFIDDLSKLFSIIMTLEQDVRDYAELLDTGNQALILWGPPGTGKTYSAKKLIQKVLGIKEEDLSDYLFEKGNKDDKGKWAIVQFHPSYSYEDFIGGISPQLEGNSLSYVLKEGIFKRFCDYAARADNNKKKYVFLIDEINRADLSSVFGELMYALEYRNEEIRLPNFTTPFKIPQNVYLIGTMNSVDKSLTTFDIALRRRFAFFKVKPNMKALEHMLARSTKSLEAVEYYIREDNIQGFIQRCERLNSNITNPKKQLRLGEDYEIGHAYFAKIKDFLFFEDESDENNPNKTHRVGVINSYSLEKLWMYHLLPLLEEYLGSRVDDTDIQKLLVEEGKSFTSDN